MDMNDRFLRRTVIGLGGKAMGVPREDGFDITAASEVMAILCLANDYADLKARLGRILLGFGRDGTPVRACGPTRRGRDGGSACVTRCCPTSCRRTEGAPAWCTADPSATSRTDATASAPLDLPLRRADVVFTEAGFGFDLGAEKFLDIKCRAAGFWPHAVVLVVTLACAQVPRRAFRMPTRGAPMRPPSGAGWRTWANTSRACASSASNRS